VTEEPRSKTIAPAGAPGHGAGTAIEVASEPPEAEAADAASVREFLGFTLGTERYGLALPSIREILKVPPITEVPRAPGHVLGIVSVRGRVTTVVDLRRRVRVEETPIGKSSRILVVDVGDEIIGALVDDVQQVYRLRDEEIELAAVVGGGTAEYVLGIGRPASARSSGRDRRGIVEGLGPADILVLLDPDSLLAR
jgi:purine-binding chemotaxis protein CheW